MDEEIRGIIERSKQLEQENARIIADNRKMKEWLNLLLYQPALNNCYKEKIKECLSSLRQSDKEEKK